MGHCACVKFLKSTSLFYKKTFYKLPITSQPKIQETFRTTRKKLRNFRQIAHGIAAWFDPKLSQDNVNMTLL